MILSIASQKGGTGKTSTSISLSAGLASKGKQVLLIDIDSQANSSKVLLPEYQKIPKEQTIYTTIIERQVLPVHQTQLKNLAIIPSHILLSNTDIELTTVRLGRLDIPSVESQLSRERPFVSGTRLATCDVSDKTRIFVQNARRPCSE